MKFTYLALVLVIIVNYAVRSAGKEPLNILGVFPYPGKSHFFVYRVLLNELVARGHNLTVISYYPEKAPSKNYHDLALPLSQEVEGQFPIKQGGYADFAFITKYFLEKSEASCHDLVSNKAVRNLVNGPTKFDVVVTEQFCTDCGLGLAYKLKAPVVGITSHVVLPWHYGRLGVPYNGAYIPLHFLGGGHYPSLYQRIERFIFHGYFNALAYFIQKKDNEILSKYWDDMPPVEELARDIKMYLLYHNFILTGSRLFPQNVKEVGGYHVTQKKPLTGELQKFVEEAEHGVIYISFGTMADSGNLPPTLLEAILTLFTELPHRFIFKCGVDNLNFDRNKVYVANWLPQTDILGHSNVKAFVGHGGLGGVTEAISFGVPMVVMPMFGDQPSNAACVEESGLGLLLNINDANKDTLLSTMKKVLDPKFTARVKEISRAWQDRPLTALDTAAFWVEYTARNPNITFTPPTHHTPWYQMASLDVIGVLSVVVLVIIYLIKSILSCCFVGKKDKGRKLKKK